MQRSGHHVWTQDDYMIGDATLNLDTWFRRSFKKRNKEPGYWDGAGALLGDATRALQPWLRGAPASGPPMPGAM